ncbi:MAG: hypothetical protein A2W61_01355 [Deltaproteobacteria bacterium RIFCSPLOWO2_01_44_7]|nr:MAG: hypothetical protein A2712_03720 [Deltaproteobacteria bacterium RIFCSPHIGHO2_01_FULL_43_49]OGQ16297.1 MAG: hypothetical protein A3D22_01690 [Deltaproteobacteria bacterium RIFCSPHIGHO2_02_FULL_44_53]OGQ29257.1 MAG: hypothetical protein A3D98_05475 [Deltaproteobacteria bacterium RIFCSPHIGHO2_12_FULL_44_21]OGQ32814.1 MAG: hypothetical protein A2979_09620 [Deltaproteobacteria bacterium RIFCSPLOWO2_01_FULL_45_74]OGQ38726.1 MAG: hypothetical protein A2W61_01355 [Deltaproteobacteria bacterium 
MRKPSTKYCAKKTKSFKIVNNSGLHARAAAEFVKVAKKFPADIAVKKGALSVNGKSILAVLMLGAENGDTIEIEATGPKAEEALKHLEELIQAGFHE